MNMEKLETFKRQNKDGASQVSKKRQTGGKQVSEWQVYFFNYTMCSSQLLLLLVSFRFLEPNFTNTTKAAPVTNSVPLSNKKHVNSGLPTLASLLEKCGEKPSDQQYTVQTVLPDLQEPLVVTQDEDVDLTLNLNKRLDPAKYQTGTLEDIAHLYLHVCVYRVKSDLFLYCHPSEMNLLKDLRDLNHSFETKTPPPNPAIGRKFSKLFLCWELFLFQLLTFMGALKHLTPALIVQC